MFCQSTMGQDLGSVQGSGSRGGKSFIKKVNSNKTCPVFPRNSSMHEKDVCALESSDLLLGSGRNVPTQARGTRLR